MVTFVVDAPRDVKSDEDQDFVDTVTFTAADSEDPGDTKTIGAGAVNWIEEDPTFTEADDSGTTFVMVDGNGVDDDASISVSVRLYDQYGNGIRQNAAGDAYYVEMGIVTADGTDDTVGHDTDYNSEMDEQQVRKAPSVSSSASRRGLAKALFPIDNIIATKNVIRIGYMVQEINRNDDGELLQTDGTAVVDADGDPIKNIADLPDSVPLLENGVEDVRVRVDKDTNDANLDQIIGQTAPDDVDLTDIDNLDETDFAYTTDVYVAADEDKTGVDDVLVDVFKIHGDSFSVQITGAHSRLYSHDDNDTFAEGGNLPAECETFRPAEGDEIRVIVYNQDARRASIYDINPDDPNG